MNKILDLILFSSMISCLFFMLSLKNEKVNKTVNNLVSIVEFKEKKETKNEILKTDTIQHKHYKKKKNEWYLFENSNFKYNYEPISYTENELNLFTNIVYRESGMGFSLNDEVNKYFVAIVGIMRIICENDKFKTITDMVKKSNSFTYPSYGEKIPFDSIKNPLQYKTWIHCKNIVKNVLECKIPSYVPYIPYGTFCYWSDDIDTNIKQKEYLKNRGIKVATTSVNSDYYLIKGYEKKEEYNYILNYFKTKN